MKLGPRPAVARACPTPRPARRPRTYDDDVSATLKQALLVAAGGLFLGLAVLALARRRLMTLRYAIGWLGLAALAIVTGILTGLITPIGDALGMTGTAVFLGLATSVLVVICIQLSISVSGLQAQVRELAEAHALLDAELTERMGPRPAP